MGKETDEYSRRVDDLIDIVQQTIRDVDDFVKGRVKVPVEEYQRYKNTLIRRQNDAMKAMNDAMAGQREVLSQLDSGKALPQRRASDVAEGQTRRRPNLNVVSEEEIFDIKLRAGIE